MTLYICGLMISFFMSYQLNFFHDQTESAKIARAIITGFTWPVLLAVTVMCVVAAYLILFLDKATDLLADVIDEFT